MADKSTWHCSHWLGLLQLGNWVVEPQTSCETRGTAWVIRRRSGTMRRSRQRPDKSEPGASAQGHSAEPGNTAEALIKRATTSATARGMTAWILSNLTVSLHHYTLWPEKWPETVHICRPAATPLRSSAQRQDWLQPRSGCLRQSISGRFCFFGLSWASARPPKPSQQERVAVTPIFHQGPKLTLNPQLQSGFAMTVTIPSTPLNPKPQKDKSKLQDTGTREGRCGTPRSSRTRLSLGLKA